MKTLIFSHVSDIDGIGGVVLAKLAFSDVDYVLCETFNLCLFFDSKNEQSQVDTGIAHFLNVVQ